MKTKELDEKDYKFLVSLTEKEFRNEKRSRAFSFMGLATFWILVIIFSRGALFWPAIILILISLSLTPIPKEEKIEKLYWKSMKRGISKKQLLKISKMKNFDRKIKELKNINKQEK